MRFGSSPLGAGLWPGLGEMPYFTTGRHQAVDVPLSSVSEVKVGPGWADGGLEVVLLPYRGGTDQLAIDHAVSWFAPDGEGRQVRYALHFIEAADATEFAELLGKKRRSQKRHSYCGRCARRMSTALCIPRQKILKLLLTSVNLVLLWGRTSVKYRLLITANYFIPNREVSRGQERTEPSSASSRRSSMRGRCHLSCWLSSTARPNRCTDMRSQSDRGRAGRGSAVQAGHALPGAASNGEQRIADKPGGAERFGTAAQVLLDHGSGRAVLGEWKAAWSRTRDFVDATLEGNVG